MAKVIIPVYKFLDLYVVEASILIVVEYEIFGAKVILISLKFVIS